MKTKILGLLFIVLMSISKAQNPILQGFADPHMKVWNGRMYISVGKDLGPEIKKFTMPYWAIYSTDDMMNWRLETQIDPGDTYIGAGKTDCWATDIVTADGKYYFYFSNGGRETGAMVSDKPNGPYVDVLGKPMIPFGSYKNFEYDPTLFTDDDGKHYIIFGRDGQLKGRGMYHYMIAPLAKDMMSFAEPPKNLLTDSKYGFGEENRARDHQYFHKYKDTYYLSCAGAYRTSKNIYGPYTNLKNTGQDGGHSSFCEFNGQWYHMYEWTCQPYGNRLYRQIVVTYLHYKDNGEMVSDPAFLQGTASAQEGIYYKTGVGNYCADWKRIEAEWFFKREGKLEKRESPTGGFEIRNIYNGDFLIFPHVSGMKRHSGIRFCVSSAAKRAAVIEIRLDNPQGKLIGKCLLKSNGSWDRYDMRSCKLTNDAGTNDLCFVFRGDNDEELVRLDYFSLD